MAPVSMLEAALRYAQIGWYVFPLGDESKVPITERGHLDATTDPNMIVHWWTENPTARIGVHLRASGLLAIDVDVADGKRGDLTLTQLEARHGLLPRALVQRSGRGGMHIVMRDPSPGPGGWTRTQDTGGRLRGKLGKELGGGVDVKCNGYIVVEPSGTYEWVAFDWQNPPEMPAAWQAAVYKADDELDAPGGSIANWQRTIIQLQPNDVERLRTTLRGLTRGTAESTTYIAIVTIFHGFGLSCADGWPYLAEWNAANPPNEQHTERELLRQMERIAQREQTHQRGHEMLRLDPDIAETPAIVEHTQESVHRERLVQHIAAFASQVMEQSKIPMFPTPFAHLNDKLGGGFSVHSLNLLVAGTGKGKSSIAGEFAAHHALTQPVIFYVGEMTPVHVAARVIGQQLVRNNPGCSVGWLDVLKGTISVEQMEAAVRGLKFYLVKRCEHPIAVIKQAIAAAQAAHPGCTPLLVIDYIQLLATIGPDMRVATMHAVREVQQLLEREPVIGLVLSQSSRGNSKRIREGSGNAEDLGDTGAETAELERSATTVMVLSYQSKDDTDEHKVNMVLAKSRFGGGTKLGFTFNGKTGLWVPVERPHADDAHMQRCSDILLQLEIHSKGKCQSGAGSCGKPMTQNEFSKTGGLHRVAGNKEAIKQALEDLKEMRKVRYQDGEWILIGGP